MDIQALIDKHGASGDLQKLIDTNVGSLETVTVESATGVLELPDYTKLRMVNCGEVAVLSAGVGSSIEYVNGPGIAIQKAAGSFIKVLNADSVNLDDVKNATVDISASVCDTMKGIQDAQVNLDKIDFTGNTEFLGGITGKMSNLTFAEDFELGSGSDVDFSLSTFKKSAIFKEAKVFLGSSDFEGVLDVTSSDFSFEDANFPSMSSFSASSVLEKLKDGSLEKVVGQSEDVLGKLKIAVPGTGKQTVGAIRAIVEAIRRAADSFATARAESEEVLVAAPVIPEDGITLTPRELTESQALSQAVAVEVALEANAVEAEALLAEAELRPGGDPPNPSALASLEEAQVSLSEQSVSSSETLTASVHKAEVRKVTLDEKSTAASAAPNLQDLVNSHADDARMPKRVVTVESLTGQVSLPKNLRLRLVNCGKVEIIKADGNNEIQYVSGEGISIKDATDCLIKIDDTRQVTLANISDSRLEIGNSTCSSLSNLSDIDLLFVDVEVSGKTEFLSKVVGDVHRGKFQHEFDMRGKSVITFDGTQFVKKATLVGSEIFLDECTFDLDLKATACLVTHTNTTFSGKTDFAYCEVIEQDTNYKLETSYDVCATTITAGTFSKAVTCTESVLEINGASFEDLICSDGSVNADGAELTGDCILSDTASILANTTISGNLNTTSESHRWDSLTVSGTANHEDSHVDSTVCTFSGSQSFTGGSFVKFRDTNQDVTAAALIGRNKMGKVTAQAVNIAGAKTRLKIAETTATDSLISDIMVLELDDYQCSGSLTLKTCGSVRDIGIDVGATLAYDGCNKVESLDVTTVDLLLKGDHGHLNFDNPTISGNVTIDESKGGAGWA